MPGTFLVLGDIKCRYRIAFLRANPLLRRSRPVPGILAIVRRFQLGPCPPFLSRFRIPQRPGCVGLGDRKAHAATGKEDCPVVQVAYEDAIAYAKWAVPTERFKPCTAIEKHYHPIGHKNSSCALGLEPIYGRLFAESV